MVSSFASQLQAIASKSSNELDLKARRNAHSESLLFEKDVAAKQDFETIYNICIEGFNELCQLDSRFHDFDRNLFAEQAKAQDREELTKSQNEALDLVLKHCLMLLGSKILLKPALKALEWLVRRFRVHVYNVNDLLNTLLPYHEVSVWANTLSIIPNAEIVGQWKFIRPYLKTTWNVPRHAVAYAASNNDSFFASINSYTTELCRQGLEDTIHMKFWSGIVVEAISSRLAQTRSGRKEIQNQRVEDLLLKVLPLLSEGYDISDSADLITTCYTITIVLAAKAELSDRVLDSLLLAVCQSLQGTTQTLQAALMTVSVVASHKKSLTLPKRVLTTLSNLEDFNVVIREVSKRHSCQQLLSTLVSSTMSHIKPKNAKQLSHFTTVLVHSMAGLYPASLIGNTMIPVVSKLLQTTGKDDATATLRDELISIVQDLNKNTELSAAISQAVASAELDAELLENLLGMTVAVSAPISQRSDDDISMKDAPALAIEPSESLSESLPSTWHDGSSFLAVNSTPAFHQICQAFETHTIGPEKLKEFAAMPLWSSTANKRLLWQTFLIRFACSAYQTQTRQKALRMLDEDLKVQPGCDIQFFIPYLLMLLTDVKIIRQSASNLLNNFQTHLSNKVQNISGQGFYGAEAGEHIVPLSQKHVATLLSDLLCPVMEECVLDQTQIIKIVQNALQANTTTDVKKSHRQALFSLLTQHALATPLFRLKVITVSMLSKVQKVGGKSKSKLLLPILQEWSAFSVESANEAARESGFSTDEIDAGFVQLTDVHDGQFLDQISQAASSSDSVIRSSLIQALFEYMRRDWNSWTADEHLSSAGILFSIAFATNEALSAGAQEVLRSVDLTSEVLATLLQFAGDGSSDLKAPPSKKKRRSSSGASQSRIDVMRTIDDTTAKISLALELVDSNVPESKPELVTVMFEMLASLKQLQQNRVESPYLLNLCLSSIYAMVRSLSPTGKSADLSGIKPELVTECLRSTDNPQVQNTALMVMAALSGVVPDRMVHNVMPIFTFIGNNMLSKDDEHSVNVVNEAIDKIVPALLRNLRNGKNVHTYQASMSTMLASFTSAYEHIPRHRKVGFYQKLLSCIDATEFGFVLVALLAAQEGQSESFNKFLEDLMSALPPVEQLTVYQKLIMLSVDVLSTSPKTAAIVYDIGKTTSPSQKNSYARSNLASATVILQSANLASAVRTLSKLDVDRRERTKKLLGSSFEITLTAIKDLKAADDDIVSLARQSLDALLRLPNMVDLLDMLETTLDSMDEAQLRPLALRVLSVQLQGKHKKDPQGRESALSLVQRLNGYVDPQRNTALVQASLACLDRIAEVYGRKNPEVIFGVAESILRHSLMTFSARAKVVEAAILTIASVVEVIKEGFVPLVSAAVAETLRVVPSSTKGSPSPSLFSTACTLLSAITSNLAFVLSESQVMEILDTMIHAKMMLVGSQDDTDFSLLVRSISQNVEFEIITGALTMMFERRANYTEVETATLLDILGQVIEASPKTTVIRQSESVSQLFQIVLGVRANSIAIKSSDTADEETEILLDQLKATSIKFIYRINDTTFRPIFESWIDWANSPDQTDANNNLTHQSSRQIALFEVLTHFFDTLKAIVTSYATYLLTPISIILQSATSTDQSSRASRPLLINALTLLRTISIHDQDSFFSAPSHFSPIASPLVSTLTLSTTKQTRPLTTSHIIPTITGLALATLDSPTTHSELVHHLVSLKSHSSPHVRLASIKTLIALTEDEDLGDEFIANTIGIGAGEGEGARGGGSSVGEIMVYVNEMLEDDDEDVERGVRRWVQLVRAKVGEDVFEI